MYNNLIIEIFGYDLDLCALLHLLGALHAEADLGDFADGLRLAILFLDHGQFHKKTAPASKVAESKDSLSQRDNFNFSLELKSETVGKNPILTLILSPRFLACFTSWLEEGKKLFELRVL